LNLFEALIAMDNHNLFEFSFFNVGASLYFFRSWFIGSILGTLFPYPQSKLSVI